MIKLTITGRQLYCITNQFNTDEQQENAKINRTTVINIQVGFKDNVIAKI